MSRHWSEVESAQVHQNSLAQSLGHVTHVLNTAACQLAPACQQQAGHGRVGPSQ